MAKNNPQEKDGEKEKEELSTSNESMIERRERLEEERDKAYVL